jgi:chromosome segregation ATPase
MTYYPTPAINKALGLEAAASLDDALTVIAQLRASLVDVAELREACDRMAREAHDTYQEKLGLLSQLGEARRSVMQLIDDEQRNRAEMKQANEALGDVQRERDTLKATLADMARLRLRIEADVRATEQARDAAFAALHHATAAYL